MTFDAFIAIDWSGGKAPYNGISVARCPAGSGGPRLVAPGATHWTRTTIAEWLVREIASGQRLLIGFDFAFGLPYEDKHGYLGGLAGRIDNIFDLWAMVERTSESDSDYGCGRFVAHPIYAPLFWTRGPKPATWIERRRQAERACGTCTGTYPESLYKLLGPKQVGKASLTGMRVLNRVRAATNGAAAVWPFERGGDSVLVEIYPTLFRKQATSSVAKIKATAVLDEALSHFGARKAKVAPGTLSDHDSDALISAAGLRALVQRQQMWDAPASVRREGWIFGVPLS
jgi:hypothetical protein